MTNKYNFKVGDKVYMAYDPTISAIVTDVCYEGKYDYYVREDGSTFTTGCGECELLDVKTAFLTRLQSLMREFDAEICYREGDCELHIDLGDGNRFDRISYLFEYPDYDINDVGRLNLTADNIMDFEKE